MQKVWEPTLAQKIDRFLSRKAQQFPELNLPKRWNEYEHLEPHNNSDNPKSNKR